MQLQPFGDRVVIEPAEPEKQSVGGILLPETSKDKPLEGVIIAVGPGRRDDAGNLIPMEAQVGDKVFYVRYANGGGEIKVEGKTLLVMHESDLLARKDSPRVRLGLEPLWDERDEIAERAYHAYGATTDFKNYQGLPMPEWDALPQKIQQAWNAAAHEVWTLKG